MQPERETGFLAGGGVTAHLPARAFYRQSLFVALAWILLSNQVCAQGRKYNAPIAERLLEGSLSSIGFCDSEAQVPDCASRTLVLFQGNLSSPGWDQSAQQGHDLELPLSLYGNSAAYQRSDTLRPYFRACPQEDFEAWAAQFGQDAGTDIGIVAAVPDTVSPCIVPRARQDSEQDVLFVLVFRKKLEGLVICRVASAKDIHACSVEFFYRDGRTAVQVAAVPIGALEPALKNLASARSAITRLLAPTERMAFFPNTGPHSYDTRIAPQVRDLVGKIHATTNKE